MAQLTLTSENLTRSVQVRRRTTAGCAPVRSTLPPQQDFVPEDMLISWILADGDTPGGKNSFSAYLWPGSQGPRHTFANWKSENGIYPASMPEWLATAADELRTAFVQGTELPGGDITSGIGLHRTYTVEGAELLLSKDGPFPVTDFSVSWTAGEERLHRYRMAAYPHRKLRLGKSRHWVGHHGGGYDKDTSDWIIEAAEQCRTDMLAHRSAP